jgi:hypothetical protein
VLHLLGHDHERARDADRMEALECRILEGFQIPDPYELAPTLPEREGRNRARERAMSGGAYGGLPETGSPPSLTLPLKGGGNKQYARRVRHG